MAIERMTVINNFQGVLADLDTLTDTTDYTSGSTFHAVDTGHEFVWFADGWLPDLRRARAIKQAEML